MAAPRGKAFYKWSGNQAAGTKVFPQRSYVQLSNGAFMLRIYAKLSEK